MNPVGEQRGAAGEIIGAAHDAHPGRRAGFEDGGLQSGIDLDDRGHDQNFSRRIERADGGEVAHGVAFDGFDLGGAMILTTEGIVVDAEGNEDPVGREGDIRIEVGGEEGVAADREVEIFGVEISHQAADITAAGAVGKEALADGIAEDQIAFAGRSDGGGVGAEVELGKRKAMPGGKIHRDPMAARRQAERHRFAAGGHIIDRHLFGKAAVDIEVHGFGGLLAIEEMGGDAVAEADLGGRGGEIEADAGGAAGIGGTGIIIVDSEAAVGEAQRDKGAAAVEDIAEGALALLDSNGPAEEGAVGVGMVDPVALRGLAGGGLVAFAGIGVEGVQLPEAGGFGQAGAGGGSGGIGGFPVSCGGVGAGGGRNLRAGAAG